MGEKKNGSVEQLHRKQSVGNLRLSLASERSRLELFPNNFDWNRKCATFAASGRTFGGWVDIGCEHVLCMGDM